MTNRNDDDGLDDVPEDQLRDELTHQMRTRGALVAYRTSVEICEDRKAPAGARATSASNLLRVAGLYSPQDAHAGAGKDLHEMTAAELRAASRKAHAELAALRRRGGSDDGERNSGSIFD